MSRYVAALRIAVGMAIVFAITWQVEDRVVHNVFRPDQYFSYFTIITSILTAMVLWVSAAEVLRTGTESARTLKLRFALTAAYVIVSIVYNLLLRNSAPSPEDGNYRWPTAPNEILHVYVPIVVLIDWVLVTAPERLTVKQAWLVLIYPLTWLALTIIRGLALGWWPYWFLNPTDEGGVPQMLTYIGIITALFTGVGFGLVALHRARNRPLA